uniref:(California timema) hypothetical protein n=1 Tax=Timema californicum TaxID=61474 RepID=A0A7R9PC13_TIMCA|nr:unnamed protein product [Timema californicum]
MKASPSKEIEIEIETQCNDGHLLKQSSEEDEDGSEDLINTNADDSNTKLKDSDNLPKVLSATERTEKDTDVVRPLCTGESILCHAGIELGVIDQSAGCCHDSIHAFQEIDPLVRLWYHECCRVFQDRLVNDEDCEWFDQLLREKIGGFGLNADKVLEDRAILFGDFLEPQSDVKNYEEIKDMEKLFYNTSASTKYDTRIFQLSKVLDQYLEDYNHHSTAPMKLVLFLDAISHVCRISRIIRQPLGNALLLGMGGSGRRSLTRLAAHMGDLTCFQIELSKAYGPVEWRDDIKNLMLKAGLENKETVFLFSDTQIKKESFLEDLNSVLNSGDVPNIYQPDELDKIYQAMRVPVTEQGLPTTRPNLFAAYQKIVRSNLHTVITMSPIGEVFRARLRQFPALVNCCTIDWFSAWPDSALQNVALQFLDDMPDLDVSQEVLKGIVVTCQFMHQSVVDASELYLQVKEHPLP